MCNSCVYWNSVLRSTCLCTVRKDDFPLAKHLFVVKNEQKHRVKNRMTSRNYFRFNNHNNKARYLVRFVVLRPLKVSSIKLTDSITYSPRPITLHFMDIKTRRCRPRLKRYCRKQLNINFIKCNTTSFYRRIYPKIFQLLQCYKLRQFQVTKRSISLEI